MREKKPLVTVIIPSYNRARFLPDAVRSVLAHTYKNLELLIVDDGSTDNTFEAVKEFLEKDGRVKYFYQENKGSSSARNAGIRKAAGDYIAFLDSDDEWFPGKISRQLELFCSDPSPGFVGCNKICRVENRGGREYNLYKIRYPAGKVRFTLEDFLKLRPSINPSSVMIKKEALLKTGFFDEKCSVHQDWELWIRLRRDHDFKTTWEPLAKYLSWHGGISRTVGPLEKSRIKKYILQKHAGLYQKHPAARARVLRNIGSDLVLGGRRKEAMVYFLRSVRALPGLVNLIHLLVPLAGRWAYSGLLLARERIMWSMKH